jgi:uncharacterized protein (DUF427 family)
MSEANVREQVTLARDTIHNPDEPRHFMRIKPVKGRVRVLLDGQVLAESTRALRVLEAGRDLYDPVLYLPADDVRVRLSPAEKRTFCPLKGHATYLDLVAGEGGLEVPEIAWSYRDTLDFAAALTGLVAFDATRVAVEEHPAAAAAS